MTLKLNCDLGESFGSWKMGLDEEVFPHIDQANVACGFHAGDPNIMLRTIKLAKQHQVQLGAHPAYPDLVGFGRRSMKCSPDEIYGMIQYQLSALDGMARSQGVTVDYVKPHGALYNDMMAQESVRQAILKAISDYHLPVKLMLQATPDYQQHTIEANDMKVELLFEAFADRCYDDDGKLLSRTLAGAVHSKEKMLAQVQQLNEQGTITTVNGNTITIKADSLCVHGDNPEGISAIQQIKSLIQQG